jgi:VWFA-related protein
VTVTDAAGRHVKNLTADDFTILEDGVPQPLAVFASGQVPLDLALVVDVSASMTPHLPIVRKAANGLLRSLRTGDRATLGALNHALAVPEPLTADLSRVTAVVDTLAASGGTALYNGLYVVLKEFARDRAAWSDIRRQVIVLLSDGLDTASHVDLDDVMELAQRGGVRIYAVSVPGVGLPKKRTRLDGRVLHAEYVMRLLAREAGGRSFFPQTPRELPAIYDDIAVELANQYELGYLPAATGDGRAFRRLAVRVDNAVARTRSGYFLRPRTVAAAVARPFE